MVSFFRSLLDENVSNVCRSIKMHLFPKGNLSYSNAFVCICYIQIMIIFGMKEKHFAIHEYRVAVIRSAIEPSKFNLTREDLRTEHIRGWIDIRHKIQVRFSFHSQVCRLIFRAWGWRPRIGPLQLPRFLPTDGIHLESRTHLLFQFDFDIISRSLQNR